MPSNEDIKRAKQILNMLVNLVSVSREGTLFGSVTPPAKMMLKKLECSEIEFVRALQWIKQNYKGAYRSIKIPRYWDGFSNVFFPEAYDGEDKIFCEVLSDDLMPSMFYDLPEDHRDRKWKRGDKVYLPETHPQTIKALKTRKIRFID